MASISGLHTHVHILKYMWSQTHTYTEGDEHRKIPGESQARTPQQWIWPNFLTSQQLADCYPPRALLHPKQLARLALLLSHGLEPWVHVANQPPATHRTHEQRPGPCSPRLYSALLEPGLADGKSDRDSDPASWQMLRTVGHLLTQCWGVKKIQKAFCILLRICLPYSSKCRSCFSYSPHPPFYLYQEVGWQEVALYVWMCMCVHMCACVHVCRCTCMCMEIKGQP